MYKNVRVALAAIFTGHFFSGKQQGSFFVVAVMGILIGLAIAHVLYAVHYKD